MNQIYLLIILFFCSSIAVGCECSKGIGKNFLRQAKDADLVALGSFHVETETGEVVIIVEKVYKGTATTKTITLRTRYGCDHFMIAKEGQRIMIALEENPSDTAGTFSASACATTVLFITGERALAANKNGSRPAEKRNRIGIFRTSMNLARLERKIRRR